MLNCTKGPKVCQEISPTLHHHQPEPLRQGRMIHAFMFFTPNSDPTSECCSRNQDSSEQATFFNLLLSSFGESVWIVSSVCCSYLTGAAPGVVFCCWSPSASGFDVLCVQRCILQTLVVTSGYLSYCYLSIISNQSVHSPLDINKAFPSHTNAAHWMFSLFRPFSVNPRDGCAWKSQ